jgi:glycosyltransferase involved in cell wall biosynthesis
VFGNVPRGQELTSPRTLLESFALGSPVFSVIVATCGRPTLGRALRSLRQEDAGDIEVLVVTDGPRPKADRAVEKLGWPAVRLVVGPEGRTWGNRQREAGIPLATGRYIMFLDDDDTTRKGAFTEIRAAVSRDPDRVTIFRIDKYGDLMWRVPDLAEGNVSTGTFLVPNVPGRLGSWLVRDCYASDFDFISETVTLQGPPVFSPAVIGNVEPFRITAPRAWLRPRVLRWRANLALGSRVRALRSRIVS